MLKLSGRDSAPVRVSTPRTMHTVSTSNPPADRFRPAVLGLLALAAVQLASAQTATPVPASDAKDDKAPVVTTDAAKDEGQKEKVFVLDEYKVTGSFRGSLAAAAEKKEASQAIVEVIASEDIGKLPDVSIADSLTRLTGLTTQRTNGRSQAISIRGLTGDFSTGMLNGREQVSTGENRAVEFDQYPAELLSEVTVYKTASADLTGQGLAGTIDMHTVSPLSKSGRTVAMNGYYQWTQLSQLTPGAKATGERFNISYIDQNAAKTLGVAFGFSHSSNPYEGQQFQSWGYPTDASGNFALGGTKSYVRTSNLDRDGAMAVIEYKPNENIHSTIDVYVSKFQEKQLLRGMEIPLAYWSSAVVGSGYTVNNGLITNMTLTNVQPVVRNDVYKRNDSPVALGWNLKLGEKSDWPVTFDVGYSRINRTDVNLETYSGLGFAAGATNPDTMTVQLVPGGIPVIHSNYDYSTGKGLYLTDPQGWDTWENAATGMQGYVKYLQSKDEMGQFKLSTSHALGGVFKSVEAGLSYSDRFKRDGENPSGYINNTNKAALAPLPAQVGTTDLSFLGLGRVYAYDPLASYANGTWYYRANNSTDMAVNSFNVREKLSQLFTQFNLSTQVAGMPLTGDTGFRLINVDQFSKGYSANNGVLNPASGGARYTNFAPSLNLTLKVQDNTLVRFSLARQVARPKMYDMRASQSWGYNTSYVSSTSLANSPWSSSGGNTKLRPWQADAVDLSLEHYFKENMGYVSLSAFYKNLVSYIYNQSVLQDFSGYPYKSATAPALWQGTASEPANGKGGRMQGLELSISLASEMISKEIKGFGVFMGGAYTDSSVQPWGPGNGTSPIAGLSRKVANITFYYERHGFSARISERYRSETREYITTFGAPNRGGDSSSGSGYTMALPEKVIDAQVSYTLQSGPAKDLTFYLQAYNLNNEPLVTYNNGDPRQVMNYQKYGASYSAGASYKF